MSSYSSSEDERLSDAESSVSSSSHVEVSNQGSRKRRKLDQPNGEEEPKQPAKPFASISRIKAKPPTSREASTNNGSSSNGLNSQDKNTFADLGVDPWLVSALASMAIKKPTGIQRESIPEILKGRDAIGGSRTGSGKTVSFAVPILQAWARDPIGIFAVILTPTRELALQIFEQVNALGAPQGVKPLLVTGGSSLQDQAIALGRRPHIVIATPGRLADHIINSGEDTICGLRKVHYVVLDEADRLLASGPGSMLPDVETCLGVLPPATQRQTLLFTATVTPEVRALKDMPRAPGKPPVFLCEIDKEDLAIPTTLQQKYIQVPVTYREPYLHTLLSTPENESKSIMIFCNRTSTANLLEHLLRSLGHRVTSLHSGLPQPSRIANLARFRAKAARILVATDVASRGLDIPEVAMVIHYDVPRDPDDYIHRSGRTARAGRSGVAVTFIGQRDVELVLAIEERVGRKMEEYHEEGVSIEGRVVREALKTVSEKKREAMLQIEEGRDVKGKRKKGLVKKAKK